jgi:hypothetical protein
LEKFLEVSVDAKAVELRERFERLLKETAEVATELDVVTGGDVDRRAGETARNEVSLRRLPSRFFPSA